MRAVNALTKLHRLITIHPLNKYQRFCNLAHLISLNINPLYNDDSLIRTFANCNDPDERSHNVTFYQGLQYLSRQK